MGLQLKLNNVYELWEFYYEIDYCTHHSVAFDKAIWIRRFTLLGSRRHICHPWNRSLDIEVCGM